MSDQEDYAALISELNQMGSDQDKAQYLQQLMEANPAPASGGTHATSRVYVGEGPLGALAGAAHTGINAAMLSKEQGLAQNSRQAQNLMMQNLLAQHLRNNSSQAANPAPSQSGVTQAPTPSSGQDPYSNDPYFQSNDPATMAAFESQLGFPSQ